MALAGFFAVDFLVVDGACFPGGFFFALDFAAFLAATFLDDEDDFVALGLADFLAGAFLVVLAGFLDEGVSLVVAFLAGDAFLVGEDRGAAASTSLRAPAPGTRLVSPPLSHCTVTMGPRTAVMTPVRGPPLDSRAIRSPIFDM